jgi:hypothetical protein
MVVNDLNLEGVTLSPLEADTPPIVHTNAVLALALSLQWLQPVPWEHRKRSEVWCRVKHVELAKGCALDGLKPAYRIPAEQALSIA